MAVRIDDNDERGIDVLEIDFNLLNDDYLSVESWPKIAKTAAPRFVPAPTADMYGAAMSAVSRASSGNESERHIAGSALGKTLEMGLKAYDATVIGLLDARIRKLAELGKLPGDLAEWCLQLKAVRNNAAHEDKALSIEDLKNFGKAIEIIFMHLFTMPGMLDELKPKKRG